ncbi:MAG TPA: hypothetical protein VLZ84_07180, partial [Asticcacaulis sp.]|nr:hypothetical protein [Asticcacaulis sp.]
MDVLTPSEVLPPEAKGKAVSIVEAVMSSPVIVFTDKAKQEKFYTDIKAEVDSFVPDVTTAKGRSAIASLAFRVTKCKTGIDAAGKKLNEDARAQINAVDAARRDIRERLDALSDQARKPLTEWEKAEDDRQKAVQAFFDTIDRLATVYASDTSSIISDKLTEMREMEAEIAPATFAEREAEALAALSKSVTYMETELARTLKAEADAAELERLR